MGKMRDEMSAKAQAVLNEFKCLPHDEQLAVYQAISQMVTSEEYGPLSDDELTTIAAETFRLLDDSQPLLYGH